jgi:hypothetical protein
MQDVQARVWLLHLRPFGKSFQREEVVGDEAEGGVEEEAGAEVGVGVDRLSWWEEYLRMMMMMSSVKQL